MKTMVFTGSPMLCYQAPPRLSTYMAAIIRRHRYIILIIICLIMLIICNWYFDRKEQSITNIASTSFVNKHSNGEIKMFQPDKQYFSINKRNSQIKDERLRIINTINTPETVVLSPFVIKTEKQNNLNHVKEIRQILSKNIAEKFKAEFTRQLDEKFETSDEEANTIPTIQHTDIQLSSPSEVSFVANTKSLFFEEKILANPYIDKEILLYPIQQLGDIFNANQKNKSAKVDNALSLSRNTTDEINFMAIENHIMMNKQKSSPMEYRADKKPVLLIDTPGCKIPRLDPWDPTVKHLIELKNPYECPGPPAFLQSNPGGSITLNETLLDTFYNVTKDDLVCYYQPIYRLHEETEVRERSIMFGKRSFLKFGVPLNEDYVATLCKIGEKRYEQYFPLVRIKENVEEEINSTVPTTPKLNIILVGIDSVSKLNFLRHFPRTHSFLNKKLKPFEMNGYSKVADNTFPNIVPMLTGRFVEHWWNESLAKTMFFDDVDFIWKEYAKRGYRTLYAEDSPFIGPFNYFKRGFYDPPTDYYFRPLGLALERWRMMSEQDPFCLNDQLEYDFLFDYLKTFVQTMETRPYFAFTMVSNLTHDYLNYAGWADEPTERLLDSLLTTGALNNSMLVLFSDHGLRYGEICTTYIGLYEQRLPLMYVHFPEWFLDQYPEIGKKLKINQDRLMTLFDIHATMVHLLDVSQSQEERSMLTMGRSILEEIPPNRTCSEAHIEYHLCPCQTSEIVSISKPEVTFASQAIVHDINSKLEPFGGVCEILKVDTILNARVRKADEIILNYLQEQKVMLNKSDYEGDNVTSINDYMLTLITKPGGAVFEGTVRHNVVDNSYNVGGINRISMYGNTSWCIDSQQMKKFCYCKIQQLT